MKAGDKVELLAPKAASPEIAENFPVRAVVLKYAAGVIVARVEHEGHPWHGKEFTADADHYREAFAPS